MIGFLLALAVLVFLLFGGMRWARAWVVPLYVEQREDGVIVQYFKQRVVRIHPNGAREVVYLQRRK
jgi:hypothetical protein